MDEGSVEEDRGTLLGICTECGVAREVWPELVRGTAVCQCGSVSFTLKTVDEYEKGRGADERRQPIDPLTK